jgi:hypothetical protein
MANLLTPLSDFPANGCVHHEVITTGPDGKEIGTCTKCGQVREYGEAKFSYKKIDRESAVIKKGENKDQMEEGKAIKIDTPVERVKRRTLTLQQRDELVEWGVNHFCNIYGYSNRAKGGLTRAREAALRRLAGGVSSTEKVEKREEKGETPKKPTPLETKKVEICKEVLDPPLHPSIQGLLLFLPTPGVSMSLSHRDSLLFYFSAMLDLLYPEGEEDDRDIPFAP